MPYDDDDDLFGEEFDFVDDDDSDADDDSELEEKPKAKPTKKKPAAKDKEKADKPAARAPKRAPRDAGKAEKPAAKRGSRRDDEPKSTEPKSPGPIPKLPPAKSLGDKAPVGYLSFAHGLDIDDEDDEPPFAEAPPAIEKAPVAPAKFEEAVPAPAPAPPEPTGPPADHVIHIYEFGKLKRTIPRKFTDEQAVGFAEEFTRTNKAYGRYAVATPDDEEPAETFAGAAKQ